MVYPRKKIQEQSCYVGGRPGGFHGAAKKTEETPYLAAIVVAPAAAAVAITTPHDYRTFMQ